MAIYPFLYVWLIPFLIIFLIVWRDRLINSWVQSLLPIFNLILLVFAIYQIRIIIGLIQFLRSIVSAAPKDFLWQDYIDIHAVSLVASVFLPLLFILPAFSKSKWFSLVIMLLYLDIVEWPIYSCVEWLTNVAIVASWFALIAGGRFIMLQFLQKK